MATVMKQMHSPRNFVSPLRKIGSVQTYQNANLARSVMLKNQSQSVYGAKKLNMNSIMHNSSQFDRGNASTIDGTQMSIQQQFEMRTEADPLEQQHNCMNLALGKPTQSFRDRGPGGSRKPARATAGHGGGPPSHHIPSVPFAGGKGQHVRTNTMAADSIISVNSGTAVELL